MRHSGTLAGKRKKTLSLWLLAVAGIAVVILVIGELTGWQNPIDREMLRAFLERARTTPFAFPAVVLTYIVAHAVLFPVTVLNLLTAMVFGALWGVIYGLGAALISAALYFWIGALLGERYLRRLMRGRVKKLDDRFADHGIIGVMLIRFIPVAPFTIVNLAAGISSVRFIDYIFGTFFALLPGAAARGLVGDSLTQIILNPSPQSAAYLGGGLLLWVAVIYATVRFTRWLKNREDKKQQRI